nr:hypothetical protein [uncultured Sediminibacterium sp.]
MQYILIFFMIFLPEQAKQDGELLAKKLPVYIQVNGVTETANLEALLRVQLDEKKFTVIGREELDKLSKAETKKTVDRNYSQIKKDLEKGNDAKDLMMNTLASITPVANKLTVTVVLNKQGKMDSCYYAVAKTPFIPNKRLPVVPRRYVPDNIVRSGDLELLAKEIISMITK